MDDYNKNSIFESFWLRTLESEENCINYEITNCVDTPYNSTIYTIKINKTSESTRLNKRNRKTVYNLLEKIQNSDYLLSFDEYKLNNEYYIKISFLLPDDISELDFSEYDSRPKILKLVYNLFNLNKFNKSVWLIENKKFTKDNKYIIGDAKGDIIFNFKLTKRNYMINIIDNDSNASLEFKDCVKNLLEVCSKFHHSPENVGLLPSNGGLNNIKQSLGNDRMDVFINSIKLYYEENESLILSSQYCSPANVNSLKNYLDEFKSDNKNGIYTFCKAMYFIDDEKFIDCICELGANPMLTAHDVFKYILLAINYWKKRQTLYINHESLRKNYFELSNNNLIFEFYVSGLLNNTLKFSGLDANDAFIELLDI